MKICLLKRRGVMLHIFITLFIFSVASLAYAYEDEVNSISAKMAEEIAKSGKTNVAVVDFTDIQGNTTELGRFLAEEFSVAFAQRQEGFRVIDRIHLKSIIKEHKLSATGIIDPTTARKLGEIAGVDALVTGSITPFGDNVRITIKILDTKSAMIIGASKGNIAKTKAIEELLLRGIETPQPYASVTPTSTSYSGDFINTESKITKKIGDLTISVRRISVASNNQIKVILKFFNDSEKNLLVARNHKLNPDLSDEKGNFYNYDSGFDSIYGNYILGNSKHALTLYPKQSNDVTMLFKSNQGIDNAEIGSVFSVSLSFILGDQKAKLETTQQVSFIDVKAQK